MSEAFPNLANAAREFIAERLDTIERNEFNDYTPEDMESAQREHDLIEDEIAALGALFDAASALTALIDAASALAAMKHPSVERLLRCRGYNYEADRVAHLVSTVSAITNKPREIKP